MSPTPPQALRTNPILYTLASGLNVEKFANNLLEQETQIVFVAVVDNRYTVLINKFREGSTLYYSPEYIRNFVQITPVIIVDALEKLKPMLGVNLDGRDSLRKASTVILSV